MAKKTKVEAELVPISELATDAGLPNWKVAALCKLAGWATDKHVTADEFDTALDRFENRQMGG